MSSSPQGLPRAHVALASLSLGDVPRTWESSPKVEGTEAGPRARFIVSSHHPASAGTARADLQRGSFPRGGLKQNVISLYVQNKDPLMNTAGLCFVPSLRVGGKSVLLHVY